MSGNPLRHAVTRMRGRDPHEENRVSSPLELFFDLTFAISFGVAAGLYAQAVASGHWVTGLISFGLSMFAVIWAWINFSWFASAYDTDDWVFRLVTMVQMFGVLILSMGLGSVFSSIQAGAHVDNRVMVFGYVIMRVALIFQWLRAAKQDPPRRATCLSYAKYLAIAQLGWILVIILNTSVPVMFAMITPLFVLEMLTPVIAERKSRTPWHAHHIAERYSLLVIIALGECLVGTTDALRAVVEEGGWSIETMAVGFLGTSIAFTMWWVYFVLPTSTALHHRPSRSFVFGYSHMFVFASITAVGAGMRIYASYLAGDSQVSKLTVITSIAIPVAVYTLMLLFLYGYMLKSDGLHLLIVGICIVVTAGSILLVAAGSPMTLSLAMLAIPPALAIVLDESIGHKHRAAALESLADPTKDD